HSNTPPAHVQGRPWWKIKRLAAMVPDPPERDHEPAAGNGPWRPTPKPHATAPPSPVTDERGDVGQLSLPGVEAEVA
ncbi:MAG: hypothetical protein AAGG08_10695, partial [Actinomycetota bacterium]